MFPAVGNKDTSFTYEVLKQLRERKMMFIGNLPKLIERIMKMYKFIKEDGLIDIESIKSYNQKLLDDRKKILYNIKNFVETIPVIESISKVNNLIKKIEEERNETVKTEESLNGITEASSKFDIYYNTAVTFNLNKELYNSMKFFKNALKLAENNFQKFNCYFGIASCYYNYIVYIYYLLSNSFIIYRMIIH